MGAPVGNQNARKAKVWQQAINRALEKRSRVAQRDALDELAEKLLAACEAGESWALKELGDRLDGKPAQAIVGDKDADPVQFEKVVREIVDPKNSDG